MNYANTKNELEEWFEWKEKCAIKRCSKENQKKLNNYADITLKKNIKKFSYSKFNSTSFLPGTSFALFEMHSLAKEYSKSKTAELNGKSYKDGLFYILANEKGAKIKLLKKYFKLYLRNSIRELYNEELKDTNEISLNTPIGKNSENENMTHEDLLEETILTAKNYETKELFELTEELADKIIDKMNFREKAILLARKLKIPYTSQNLEKITERKKSSIESIYKNVCNGKYIHIIEDIYPKEPSFIIEELYKLTIYTIKEKLIAWGEPEKTLEPLFKEKAKRESQRLNGDKS